MTGPGRNGAGRNGAGRNGAGRALMALGLCLFVVGSVTYTVFHLPWIEFRPVCEMPRMVAKKYHRYAELRIEPREEFTLSTIKWLNRVQSPYRIDDQRNIFITLDDYYSISRLGIRHFFFGWERYQRSKYHQRSEFMLNILPITIEKIGREELAALGYDKQYLLDNIFDLDSCEVRRDLLMAR